MIHSNTLNHLTLTCFTNHIYLISMFKPDSALNNLQSLICHRSKPNQINISWGNLSLSILKWKTPKIFPSFSLFQRQWHPKSHCCSWKCLGNCCCRVGQCEFVLTNMDFYFGLVQRIGHRSPFYLFLQRYQCVYIL